jgi:putative peptide zinc metalloprotease protein
MSDAIANPHSLYRLAFPFDLRRLEWTASEQGECKYYLSAGDRSFYVNARLANFIYSIVDNKPADGAKETPSLLLNEQLISNMSTEENLILQKLFSLGVILNADAEVPTKPSDAAQARQYIAAQTLVLPKKLVSFLPNIFKWLYLPWSAAPVLTMGIGFLCYFFASNADLLKHPFVDLSQWLLRVDGAEFLAVFLLSIVATFFHEIGHVSAARYFGVDVEKVGFGFYLFSPVFYSDVTSTWAIRPRDRIVVNLGGIYFQFIFLSVVAAIGTFFNVFFTKVLYLVGLISIAWNLVPFLRTDGFWIYCDAFQIHNLHASVSGFYRTLFRRDSHSAVSGLSRAASRRKFGVALYAVARPIFLMVYAYSGILFYMTFIPGVDQIFKNALMHPSSKNIVHALIGCMYLVGLIATPALVVKRIQARIRERRAQLSMAT